MSLEEKETLRRISQEQNLSQSELVRKSIKLLDNLSSGEWKDMKSLEQASEVMEAGLREMSDTMIQLVIEYSDIALKIEKKADEINSNRNWFVDHFKLSRVREIQKQFHSLGLFLDLSKTLPNSFKEKKKKPKRKPKK